MKKSTNIFNRKLHKCLQHVALVALALDQLSKYFILNYVMGEQIVINVLPFFNLVRAWNTGVSFSMFNNYGAMGALMLSLVALLIVIGLLVWLKDEQDKIAQVALGLIIGGCVYMIVYT